jgi:hypothetical protein
MNVALQDSVTLIALLIRNKLSEIKRDANKKFSEASLFEVCCDGLFPSWPPSNPSFRLLAFLFQLSSLINHILFPALTLLSSLLLLPPDAQERFQEHFTLWILIFHLIGKSNWVLTEDLQYACWSTYLMVIVTEMVVGTQNKKNSPSAWFFFLNFLRSQYLLICLTR